MKKIIKELIDRVKFTYELWQYEKQKRNEDLWVAREEE
jgi:molybdopterin synthase catalytic subunit